MMTSSKHNDVDDCNAQSDKNSANNNLEKTLLKKILGSTLYFSNKENLNSVLLTNYNTH